MGRLVIFHSQPTIDADDIASVTEVLQSKHLEDGKVVRDLEEFATKYFKKEYAIAVASGFSAIHLALIALGINKNDEVILPSYSCSALLNPILLLGGKPIIVDVEKNSFNLSLSTIESHITKNTKAIIVPHIFGFPAKIDELQTLNIPIIEDCAQAIGGEYKNQKLGTIGHLGVLSFYASKMITSGDGGLIITDNPDYQKTIQNYRYYGHKRMHNFVAYNYHLTNLPAALALSQFKKLESFVFKRKQIAIIYDNYFKENPNIRIDFTNKEDACYYRYPVMLNTELEIVKSKMEQKGIQCGYGVLEGLHQRINLKSSNFPNTESNLKTILSLPIYPTLSIDDTAYIAKNLIAIVNSN